MGKEQALDDKTGILLQCGKTVLNMAGKVIVAAKGKSIEGRKGTNKEEKNIGIDVANNPNRTLFSPRSLREHHVPGYGEEPTANLGEVEEPDR